MDNKTVRRPWIRKIVIAAVVAELSYVILLNIALQLPLTQSLINQIKPEKFNIAWESAWTWYPFRFHIRDSSGNGQSRSQQWAFDAQSVSASIAITPLFFKRVWIDDVRVSGVEYFQRPRLKPDKDYTGLVAFYPPIGSREVTAADITPKKKKNPWHVDIEDIRLDGSFDYWVHQFRGQARGTLEAELDVVSRGGLFSLTIADVDLEFKQHFIKGVEVFRQGGIFGKLGFSPFIPRENKGAKLLQHLLLDVDIDIYVRSLAFVDLFTSNFKHMSMDGTGRVDGHLSMEKGYVLDGTGLSIDADDLNIGFLSHMISGDGDIGIKVDKETGNQFGMDVRFNDLTMHHAGGGAPLFEGAGLSLNFKTENDFFHKADETEVAESKGFNGQKKSYELVLKIPTARVADMSVFNYYIPGDSPFLFSSGTADLTADILLKPDDAKGYLRLKATDMQAQIDDQSISTDFSADFSLAGGAPENRLFDISGTEFRLDDVEVKGENDQFEWKNWMAVIALNQAELVFADLLVLKTQAEISMTDSRPIVAMLGNQKDLPRWVKNMLTVERVKSMVNLDMSDNQIVIPHAFMNSDKIDFGAKGIFNKGVNDGVIYARYKKLDIVAKYSDGTRNIDLIGAKRKFDEYQLPSGTAGLE